MRSTVFYIVISAITLTACNNSSNKESVVNKMNGSTQTATQVSPFTSPANGILQIYLQMKNAFVNDDDIAAAKAGNEMVEALNGFEKWILRDNEIKPFEEIAEEMKKHAEHIGANTGNIIHQREHFDTLSKEMYEMIKTFAAGEQIYVTHCPMYNDRKGAIWISETEEIKNPYFGSGNLTCGKITETLR